MELCKKREICHTFAILEGIEEWHYKFIWYMNVSGPYNPTISWVVSALLGSVVFLEWVWPCWRKYVTLWMCFEVSYTHIHSVSIDFLWPQAIDVSALVSSLPACQPISRHNNGLNLWNCNGVPSTKYFLYKNCCGLGISSQ